MRQRASNGLRVRGIRSELLADGVGVRQLRDGEPVELAAFQLPPFCRRFEQLGLEFFDRVRVEPDDTVVLVALQPPVPPLLDGEEPV